MSILSHESLEGLTIADLVDRFGPMPMWRIVSDPPPGSATEADAVRLNEQGERLCELVDGVLVEKTVGAYESYLAMLLGRQLGNFVDQHDLGIVLGADGMLRLAPGLVRIPDISFIAWRQLPDREVPRTRLADLAPDLAVEIISRSNTAREMDRKLADYFAAGTRAVWYVYPNPPRVVIFGSPTQSVELDRDGILNGGDVLPGFTLPLVQLFKS